jgi:hypothetical protein
LYGLDGAVGLPYARRYPRMDFDRSGTSYRVFLDRVRGHRAFGQSQRGGFVVKGHVNQGEISNQHVIFRLIFEKKFYFIARFPPAFFGRGMVAGLFVRPALPKAECSFEVS